MCLQIRLIQVLISAHWFDNDDEGKMTVNLFITQMYLTASEGLNYSARCVNTFKVCKKYVYNFFFKITRLNYYLLSSWKEWNGYSSFFNNILLVLNKVSINKDRIHWGQGYRGLNSSSRLKYHQNTEQTVFLSQIFSMHRLIQFTKPIWWFIPKLGWFGSPFQLTE